MSCRVRNTYSLLASTSCSKQFLKGCVRHETDYRARPLKMPFLQVVLESVATVSLHALVDMTMHGQLNIYWKKNHGECESVWKTTKAISFLNLLQLKSMLVNILFGICWVNSIFTRNYDLPTVIHILFTTWIRFIIVFLFDLSNTEGQPSVKNLR